MSIDLVKKFGKYEKTITRHVCEWKETYYKSECYKKLTNRYDRLRASINMQFPTTYGRSSNRATNEFISKVAFPLVRERYLFRRAVIKRNYRPDPLITIVPTGNTPIENAINLQDVLNLNYKATRFRETAFEKLVDDVSRFGAGVCYGAFERSSRQIKRTQMTPFGPMQKTVPEARALCQNHAIHILNYFQNPHCNDPEYSDIRGFIDHISVAELKNLVVSHPDNYIRENLEKVIKEAKTSSLRDENYHYDDKEKKDFSRSGIDLVRVWCKLPIEDNEDDDATYYLEMVGDIIIRFQDNPNDEDICNLTILKIRNNQNYWWGNTDPEDVMPHENFFSLFMNIKADSAIKQLERYIFYPKNAIDTADINNRHVNNGWVGVDVKPGMTLNNMIAEYQGQDRSLQASDWMVREVKESAQKMSTRPDFLRSGNKGGMANNTATAASMLDQVGDYLEEDMLEIFSHGLGLNGRKDAILLIQNLGELIAIRPDPKAMQREIWKEEIIGQYAFTAESSLQKSTIGESIRLQNVLTGMINFMGTGLPVFQGINPIPIVKNWIKKLDVGDVDIIYPDQNQMAQPGYQPSALTPGQENAGAVQELVSPPEAGALEPQGAVNVA